MMMFNVRRERAFGLVIFFVALTFLSFGAEAAAQPAGRVIADWTVGSTSDGFGALSIQQWGTVTEASIGKNQAVLGEGVRTRLESADGSPPTAHVIYPVDLVPGHVYGVSLQMRADVPTDVQVMVRERPAPYDAHGVRTANLGPQWTAIEFDTAWPFPGQPADIRIALEQRKGTFDLRRLTVVDKGPLPLNASTVNPFPPALIGIHVNKLGQHHTWPRMGERFIRLWDTYTNWHHLMPTPGDADRFDSPGWRRLDEYVDYATRNNPNGRILYVFGEPPRWASSAPDAKCAYGQGTCGGPATIALWRHYVHAVSVRYKGRIRDWELWNEPDYDLFFNSTLSLVELAKAAKEELTAVDPLNRLISPGFTSHGTRALEKFLHDGGGRYVDGIGFHWYYGAKPEELAPQIFNVRQSMGAYGALAKPLWNTEGSPLCEQRREGRCVLGDLSEDEQDFLVERAIMTMWLNGVSGYAYYFVEGMQGATIPLLRLDFKTLSASGQGLADFSDLMAGASVQTVTRVGSQGYRVQLRNDQSTFALAWSADRGDRLDLSHDSAESRLERMNGRPVQIPENRVVPLGPIPLVIRP